ncbi:GrpB family protein [Litoribacter populi]|uniref:GrpB family protein n=1 Tax=Litoribacter populi TaxID=2598460 RepID=UPI00117F633D|nr:GrpB family protein [Litoribacter populi]
MNKKLEDLTKHEWDTLFPIELVNHNLNWKNIFEQERRQITEKIGDKIISIEHVGSTAILDIKAKPYIDISIEIPKENLFDDEIIDALQDLNYHFFRQIGKDADYMIFVKGYNLDGLREQIFHIHMCPPKHEMLDQIIFRDYLTAYPKRAKEYEQLKTELAAKYKNDRVGYRVAKDDFIAETLNRGRQSLNPGRRP